MKKSIFILVLLLFNFCARTQDTVNIWNCFQLAEVTHPLYQQKELNAKSTKYSLSNISKSWYPAISLNGQATYQSDVVGFGTFTSPHDQYKLSLDLNQQLYDGGVSKNRKEIEKSNLDINQQQVELELHNIKMQVNAVFFSIVNLKKNMELISITHTELNERMKILQVAIQNGTLLPENEYILKAEILKIEQQQDELNYRISAAVESLNKLTGSEISSSHVFIIPYNVAIGDSIADRPEILLFEFQKTLIDNRVTLNKSIIRPKVFAFTQAGYGKPGLNMLSNEFDSYYIAGVGLKWNLIDWGETRNKEKIGNLQKKSVDLNESNFNRNISIALRNELADIEFYNAALVKDEELVVLRNKIKESAYSRLQNGTITATDYLAEANAELYAKLQLETHKILLVQSIINYQLIKGDI